MTYSLFTLGNSLVIFIVYICTDPNWNLDLYDVVENNHDLEEATSICVASIPFSDLGHFQRNIFSSCHIDGYGDAFGPPPHS